MSVYKPVNVGPTLVETTFNKMKEEILDTHPYGKRLPSEQELCNKYGVSRVVIREVLKELSAVGLIKKVVGSGSYVTKPEPKNVADILVNTIAMNKIKDKDMFQMRVILETAAVKYTALNINDSQLKELTTIVDSIESNITSNPEVKANEDILFHISIGRFCGNELLSIILESIADVYGYFIRRSSFAWKGQEDPNYGHREILAAIKDHNPKLAARLLEEHLIHSFENLEKVDKATADTTK